MCQAHRPRFVFCRAERIARCCSGRERPTAAPRQRRGRARTLPLRPWSSRSGLLRRSSRGERTFRRRPEHPLERSRGPWATQPGREQASWPAVNLDDRHGSDAARSRCGECRPRRGRGISVGPLSVRSIPRRLGLAAFACATLGRARALPGSARVDASDGAGRGRRRLRAWFPSAIRTGARGKRVLRPGWRSPPPRRCEGSPTAPSRSRPTRS